MGNGARLKRLQNEGLDAEFKGWYTGDTKHVLICPSSPTVTRQLNNMTQEDWVTEVKMELMKHTDRELIVRNKPRPGNEWWNTNIREQLKRNLPQVKLIDIAFRSEPGDIDNNRTKVTMAYTILGTMGFTTTFGISDSDIEKSAVDIIEHGGTRIQAADILNRSESLLSDIETL